MKPKAIYLGYSNHDCEAHYQCPLCHRKFGSWAIFTQEPNSNGNKKYCPKCKTELAGLD